MNRLAIHTGFDNRYCLQNLHAPEPFPLPLVFLEENHSVFQSETFRGECIYASSEQIRDNYEMNVLRRAADFKPFLEKFLQEALEG